MNDILFFIIVIGLLLSFFFTDFSKFTAALKIALIFIVLFVLFGR